MSTGDPRKRMAKGHWPLVHSNDALSAERVAGSLAAARIPHAGRNGAHLCDCAPRAENVFPFELQTLAEDKGELVSQFIYFKVFRSEATTISVESFPEDSAPTNGFAVRAYFRRYFIDCLRHAGHQRTLPSDDSGAMIEIEQRRAPQNDPIRAVLIQYDFDELTVRESATRLISGLDGADRLLLAGSLGALSNVRGGLSRIAERFEIASYHYRARMLGVTLKKGSVPTDFATTSIGQWIEHTLGIDITWANRGQSCLRLNPSRTIRCAKRSEWRHSSRISSATLRDRGLAGSAGSSRSMVLPVLSTARYKYIH